MRWTTGFVVSIVAAMLLGGGPQALADWRGELPAGTVLPVRFETSVSSATSHPEDRVIAVLREDVRLGGRVVLPAGSELRGVVVNAVPSGRVKTRARLALSFDSIEVDGERHPIRTRTIDLQAAPTRKRDAGIVAGSTGAGAVVGALADGGHGAKVGALIGAGAGTAAVLHNKGNEVTLASGTRWRVRLSQPLVIR
jgi:hypothetical protein